MPTRLHDQRGANSADTEMLSVVAIALDSTNNHAAELASFLGSVNIGYVDLSLVVGEKYKAAVGTALDWCFRIRCLTSFF